MKWIRTRDLYFVAGILLLAAVLFTGYRIYVKNQPAKAEIYYESKRVKTILLNTGKEESFSLSQAEQVVFHLYSDGSIGFQTSDCPDKVCIKSGQLRWVGQSAACLPYKMILKIVPMERTKEDVDMIG